MPMRPAFDYEPMLVREIRALIKTRKINTTIKAKTDLIAALEDVDNTSPWPLTRFPPEIRNRIFRFVALLGPVLRYRKRARRCVIWHTFRGVPHASASLAVPGVALASRQLHAEVMPVFLKNLQVTLNGLWLRSLQNHPKPQENWLARCPDFVAAQFRRLRIFWISTDSYWGRVHRAIYIEFHTAGEKCTLSHDDADAIPRLSPRDNTQFNTFLRELEMQANVLCKDKDIGHFTSKDIMSLAEIKYVVK